MKAAFPLLLIFALAADALGGDFETHAFEPPAEIAATVNARYALYAPPDAKTPLPLVVYLHGAGAKGDDGTKPTEEPLPKWLASPEVQRRFPCFVLAPQCRSGEDALGRPNNWVKWVGQKDARPARWERSEDEPSDQLRGAMAALEDVLARRPIDRTRVYLAGVSMGGSGAWWWAAREPERFAAVVACCGLSETRRVERLRNLPLWCFHGTDDDVAPVERSRRAVAALRAMEAPVKFTEFSGVGHNIARRVLEENDLATWLFAQRRAEPMPVEKTSAATPASESDAEFFANRVRPLLIARCHECHAEDEQSGGLRLDSRAAALAGGDLGPAVVPGEPDQSRLVHAIRYSDDELQMPPAQKLPDGEIAVLVEWVKRGAPWPGDDAVAPTPPKKEMVFTPEQLSHWAWRPLAKPPLPASAGERHPIDAFLDAKLAEAGIRPAPPAAPRVLARRLSFDLTGLPPTPEDVAAFERDAASEAGTAGAVARAVDRLLASPHHGERFARHWLDVARYADTNGSEVDLAMANAWRYRDYVVANFNDDEPFDRFVREQIAGDLLPDADADSLVATGFLMIGPKALAELDKPKLVADVIDEQVDTIGRAFLGLTLGCCRCHDHKFDPLPTADYYALAGIFASTRTIDPSDRLSRWLERPVNPSDAARVATLETEIARLRAERDSGGKRQAPREPFKLDADAAFVVFEAEDFARGNVRTDGDDLGRAIGVVRTLMQYPDHFEYELELPAEGEYQLELRYAAKESRPTELRLNGNLEEMAAAAEVTGDWKPSAQRWFVQGRYRFRAGKNTLVFHRDGPVPLFDKILVGRVSDQPHSKNEPLPVAKPARRADDSKRLDEAIAAAQKELESIAHAMAPQDGPVADSTILVRGNPATPGPVVPRGFPRVLAGVTAARPGAGESGRRELAEWITSPDNPLTARVIVNRVWQWHFGHGLVRSPDNFGLRGELPSHPELLDWLAVWFVENGWSLKKLHRLICTSEAYRRSSRPIDAAREADPENKLLSHFPRRRLAAEELRDAMLATAGRLDLAVGGSLMTVLNRTYANGGSAPRDVAKQMHYESPRRSIYLPVVRTALHDFLAAFDHPDPAMLAGRRGSTTVAPQALYLLNSPFVKEQAEAFARRVIALEGDDAQRVRTAFALAFARPPSDAEVERTLAFVAADEAALAAEGVRDARRAAWSRACHALLASNEFFYVE